MRRDAEGKVKEQRVSTAGRKQVLYATESTFVHEYPNSVVASREADEAGTLNRPLWRMRWKQGSLL